MLRRLRQIRARICQTNDAGVRSVHAQRLLALGERGRPKTGPGSPPSGFSGLGPSTVTCPSTEGEVQ